MKPFVVKQIPRIRGILSLPGDKSIAHRSLIISSLANGNTKILNFPANDDCLYTLNALKKLGVRIIVKGKTASLTVNVTGQGLCGLHKPHQPVFVGDSGTTLRLILGVLAGQFFRTKLTAGRSLSQRPMLRVNQPLRMMGARIKAKINQRKGKIEEHPPITIEGGILKPITYTMPVASAQVKSAILLAGLYAQGKTHVLEPMVTRDHTERMLKLFKAGLKLHKNEIVITGNRDLVSPGKIIIPGDISSAAFFLVLAAILPGSRLIIKNVGLNPNRAGIIRILKRMGADLKVMKSKSPAEPMGDILIKSSRLKGITVKASEIPSIIDELPVLMVAACCAHGKSIFEGVGELRLKETDRIQSMRENLRRMGASIRINRTHGSENITIQAQKQLKAANLKSFGDHRTCLSMIVAGLAASGRTQIDDISCINKSFPNFIRVLTALKSS